MSRLRIRDVDPFSPLFGYVRPGWTLVSVNEQPVEDEIDFRYKISEDRISIVFANPDDEELEFEFEDIDAVTLGLTLDDRKIKLCKNDCIFCFILQQPPGMRRTLYLKDEDYRLSFTHGNFITLSNTSDSDLERIVEQKLSPLYISVHATDDTLRRCMLRNERLAPIVPRIKYLTDNGITVHTQAVLCPEINDGAYAEQTIRDLAALHPGVESLAVVPVGLTRYRDGLAKLRPYRPDEARRVVAQVEAIQQDLLAELGTRFVWPADEFYTIADLDFPGESTYEHTPQFENGIGMCREFITGWHRRKRWLRDIQTDRRILMLTGTSAYPFLSRHCLPYLRDQLGLRVDLHAVTNRFWGETVTVSGLLTGQDLLRHARQHESKFDLLILPPNCTNDEDLFLDNLTLTQFRQALKKPVVIGHYNLADTIREAVASDSAVVAA